MLEQVAQKLQGYVLERQCDAMEKFEDMNPILAYHRCHLGMAERGIGTVDQPFEHIGRDVVHKSRDNLPGKFRVGKRAPAIQLLTTDLGI